jgi:hypothetical protein
MKELTASCSSSLSLMNSVLLAYEGEVVSPHLMQRLLGILLLYLICVRLSFFFFDDVW